MRLERRREEKKGMANCTAVIEAMGAQQHWRVKGRKNVLFK